MLENQNPQDKYQQQGWSLLLYKYRQNQGKQQKLNYGIQLDKKNIEQQQVLIIEEQLGLQYVMIQLIKKHSRVVKSGWKKQGKILMKIQFQHQLEINQIQQQKIHNSVRQIKNKHNNLHKKRICFSKKFQPLVKIRQKMHFKIFSNKYMKQKILYYKKKRRHQNRRKNNNNNNKIQKIIKGLQRIVLGKKQNQIVKMFKVKNRLNKKMIPIAVIELSLILIIRLSYLNFIKITLKIIQLIENFDYKWESKQDDDPYRITLPIQSGSLKVNITGLYNEYSQKLQLEKFKDYKLPITEEQVSSIFRFKKYEYINIEKSNIVSTYILGYLFEIKNICAQIFTQVQLNKQILQINSTDDFFSQLDHLIKFTDFQGQSKYFIIFFVLQNYQMFTNNKLENTQFLKEVPENFFIEILKEIVGLMDKRTYQTEIKCILNSKFQQEKSKVNEYYNLIVLQNQLNLIFEPNQQILEKAQKLKQNTELQKKLEDEEINIAYSGVVFCQVDQGSQDQLNLLKNKIGVHHKIQQLQQYIQQNKNRLQQSQNYLQENQQNQNNQSFINSNHSNYNNQNFANQHQNNYPNQQQSNQNNQNYVIPPNQSQTYVPQQVQFQPNSQPPPNNQGNGGTYHRDRACENQDVYQKQNCGCILCQICYRSYIVAETSRKLTNSQNMLNISCPQCKQTKFTQQEIQDVQNFYTQQARDMGLGVFEYLQLL